MEHLEGMMDYVVSMLQEKFAEARNGPSIWEGMQAFFHAVDWKEPWIMTVITAQAIFFLSIVLTRHNTNLQTFYFCALFALVYSAERLNMYCHKNWAQFSKQNYFDKSGLFMSVLYSGPLMLDMMLVLVYSLVNMSRMLIKVKRAELRAKSRAAAKVAAKTD